MSTKAQEQQIVDFADMVASAKDQYDDELITLQEFGERVNKYIADFRAGLEVGNRWMVMTFGKHVGEKTVDLPTSYLKYLVGEEWVSEKFIELRDECLEILKFRGEL